MSEKKLNIIKTLIDNFIVPFVLALGSAITSQTYDMNILWCTLLGFVVSLILSFSIPAVKITNAVAKLFKIKPNTLPASLVGGLVVNLYFCPILHFSCKVLIFFPDINVIWYEFITTFPSMYVMAYITVQITINTTSFIFNRIKRKQGDKQCV
jgi:hypothetical protein